MFIIFLKAPSKSQQEALSSRYELKVAANKRADWYTSRYTQHF